MNLDSEWTLFWVTYAASALTALSPILLSGKPLSFRLVFGTVILYGGLGSGFGMTIVYEYLGGKQHPIRIIAGGMLVGAGAIKKKDITMALRAFITGTLKNILGVIDTTEPPKRQTKPKEEEKQESD